IDFFRHENEGGKAKKLKVNGVAVTAFTVRPVAPVAPGLLDPGSVEQPQNPGNNQAKPSGCSSCSRVSTFLQTTEKKEDVMTDNKNNAEASSNWSNRRENRENNQVSGLLHRLPDGSRVEQPPSDLEQPARLTHGVWVVPTDSPGKWEVV